MEIEYKKNPVKAIRMFCLDCCGDSPTEVKLCPSKKCPLYPFRFGKNPFRQHREMTEEQRKAASERLKRARNNIGNNIEDFENEDENED